MSISATTCITYTGSTPLGPTLYLYSDVDGYSTSFGSVSTSDVTPPNCPYLITGIPDGATIIRLRDYISGCCIDIPITSDDLCVVCSLSLSDYQNPTVSQIIAGDLLSSCGEITDYVINWYGPNSSTNVGYTSGLGSTFNYQFTHPLTGDAAIFAQAGTYTPIIDKAIINGIPFSQTGGTGYNPAIFDCFPEVVVDPLRCTNGNFPSQTYVHQYAFDNAAAGVTPQPLSATFVLSANTNYFAFQFKGYSVYDRLTITYSGSSYPGQTFTLEDVKVGTNAAPGTFFTFPRAIINGGYVSKVLTLTGFTVNDGDFLTLQVTPNTTISQTNWNFNFTCLENFSCSSCLDLFEDTPYKIVLSTVTGITQDCNRSLNRFKISGCTSTQLNSEDIFKYFSQYPAYAGQIFGDSSGLITLSETLYWTNSSCSGFGPGGSTTCATPNNNDITYDKGSGYLTITCSDYTDFLSFANGYNAQLAFNWPSPPYSNTDIEYYRAFAVTIPLISGATQCGDGTTWRVIDIHYSSLVTTGATNPVTGPWSINFTMPLVTTGITYTTCDVGCTSAELSIVNGINNFSTASTYNLNITTNTGARANSPITSGYKLTVSNAPYTGTGNYTGSLSLSEWQVETTPWTGSSTYVDAYSGQTCSFNNFYNTTIF